MLVSFHDARFIRGDPSNKSIESHAGHTQREGAYRLEASRVRVWRKVSVTGGIQRWRGARGSQTRQLQGQHTSGGVEVRQGSERDTWHSQARPLGGRSSEFL